MAALLASEDGGSSKAGQAQSYTRAPGEGGGCCCLQGMMLSQCSFLLSPHCRACGPAAGAALAANSDGVSRLTSSWIGMTMQRADS